MITIKDILEITKQSNTIESKAIANLINFLNKDFEKTVKFILTPMSRTSAKKNVEMYQIAKRVAKKCLMANGNKYNGVAYLRYSLKEGIL